MKQYNYKISEIDELIEVLQSKELTSTSHFKTQLIQIFSFNNNYNWYITLANLIRESFPSAVIVGASSVGEINEGKIYTNSTVILFSFFERTSIDMFAYKCAAGSEEKVGEELIKATRSRNSDIKGMLLLSTPISNDSGKIFNTLTSANLNFPVFGGGAGDYANKKETLVFDGTKCYKEGVLAVVFSGDSIHIEIHTSLGWLPLSKEMTITETGNVSVKTIDDMPAFSVYKKYLGIKADGDFFQNSLEFPFLLTRNNKTIARTPFFVNENDGSIQLVGDVQKGEKFRIGYGNPQTIQEESFLLQKKMVDFKPEAIFLYTCICRRFLMQEEVDFETLPFNKIAPTAGFYTFGEFFSDKSFNSLLNSSMVTVGFREGAPDSRYETMNYDNSFHSDFDPYTNKHNRILSRLLFFIDVLIKELEIKNQKLKTLNEQKNEFLGIAAHDLRSPIGVIRGFSQLLEESIENHQYQEYASIITKESSTMLDLLNDLLDISKIEAGRLDLKKERLDYIALLNNNVKLANYIAKNKRIKIIGEYEMKSLELSIDAGKIEQVLNNIVGNAIKYSPPDSNIYIKVFNKENKVFTQITDQGKGIPENEINSIFIPFKKSSSKPTGGETSHGLGLAIVKKIIEGHNGTVGVHSEINKGSTFYFSLPNE